MTQTAASADSALQTGVEVWRGGVTPWECDENGHMNVRFYIARAMEGLVGLAARLGMSHAFSPHASATLRVTDMHIRFLREARPPAGLHMIAGVLEMGETDARFLLTLIHSATGAPSASFNIVVTHVTPGEGRAFAWSRAVRERAAALTTATPAYAAMRGVDPGAPSAAASLARAEALGMTTIASGALMARDCDVFGRMNTEYFIGRIYDGIDRVANEQRDIVMAHASARPARIGAAALEYRLIHLNWPLAGDRFVIRSAVIAVADRTLRMVHWMLDPETGAAWAMAEAVTATLDLDARKIIPITQPARDILARMILPGARLTDAAEPV